MQGRMQARSQPKCRDHRVGLALSYVGRRGECSTFTRYLRFHTHGTDGLVGTLMGTPRVVLTAQVHDSAGNHDVFVRICNKLRSPSSSVTSKADARAWQPSSQISRKRTLKLGTRGSHNVDERTTGPIQNLKSRGRKGPSLRHKMRTGSKCKFGGLDGTHVLCLWVGLL